MLYVKFIQGNKHSKDFKLVWCSVTATINFTNKRQYFLSYFNYTGKQKIAVWTQRSVQQLLTSGLCLQTATSIGHYFLTKFPHFMLLIYKY